MYDLHCHILHGVDDGPKNLEESIKMAEILYNEGIKNIVLTSHLNHPFEFQGNSRYNEAFDELKDSLHKKNPDINIFKGAEVYISRNKLTKIESLPLRTINGSSYVLIEFSRDIKLIEIDKTFYELKHLGFKPIIAHIEQYSCFENNMETLMYLHDDGLIIQCNASSFFIKDKKTRDNVRTLLDYGLVDIIASDFHGSTNSPIEFNKAYKWIIRQYGRETAKQIFGINPQNILCDAEISRIKLKKYKLKSNINKTIIAAASAFILIFAILYLNNNHSIIALTNPDTNLNTETANIEKTTNDKTNTENDTMIQIISTANIEMSESSSETEIIDITEAASSETAIDYTQSEEEELINNYVVYFRNLENEYVLTVDEYYLKIRNALEIINEEEKKDEVNHLLDELSTIEAESDNEIYKALYDMQNDLEENNYDVGIVEEIREHYLNRKIEISNKYEIELEKYLQ